jgi:hypothetical protein
MEAKGGGRSHKDSRMSALQPRDEYQNPFADFNLSVLYNSPKVPQFPVTSVREDSLSYEHSNHSVTTSPNVSFIDKNLPRGEKVHFPHKKIDVRLTIK